jgi:hypothetical protein
LATIGGVTGIAGAIPAEPLCRLVKGDAAWA